MATKSFLKDINISDRKLAQSFADALESINKERYKSKEISRPVREIKGSQIKEFFKKND